MSCTDGIDILCQITPSRIVLFNQVDLPSSSPILHLPLAVLGIFARWKFGKPDKPSALILARKPGNFSGLMLPGTPDNIVGMADIKRPVLHTGRDVNVEHLITPEQDVPILIQPANQPVLPTKVGIHGGWLECATALSTAMGPDFRQEGGLFSGNLPR